MHSSITLQVGSSYQGPSGVLCSEVILRHLRMLQATTEGHWGNTHDSLDQRSES